MMELNTWGVVGVCYLVFWNIIALLAGIVSRKTDKNFKWIPVVVALATIPPFLFGLFGGK